MAADKGERKEEISSDFVFNHYVNVSKQYGRIDDPKEVGIQIPFSLIVKGPRTIRNRDSVYKVTKS